MMRPLRTPGGGQLPADIALHRAGWWVAIERCTCCLCSFPHFRSVVWTRPQRRGSGDFAYDHDPSFCRSSRRAAVYAAVACIQQLRRETPEYWARRAKQFGVPRELVYAWAHTSAWVRRPAPTKGVEAVGEYLVYSKTRQDEGDGVVSYRMAHPRRWWWIVLVPPPGVDMFPLRTTAGDIRWYRRKVREARLAAEPPTLMAQPIIGWRAWDVYDGELISPFQGTPWTPGRPLVAMLGDEPVERVEPDAGIYALRDREHASDGEVVGLVALWGDVLECKDGWVAQYAYPYALPAKWARIYGCEVLDAEKAPA